MIPPRFRQRGQGRVRSLGRLKPCGLPVPELLGAGLGFALLRFVDAGRGALKGWLRRYDQPALGHAIVTQRDPVRADGVSEALPGVLPQCLGDHERDERARVGNPRAQAQLLEVGRIVLIVQFGICHQVPRRGRTLKGGHQRRGSLLEHRRIRRIALPTFGCTSGRWSLEYPWVMEMACSSRSGTYAPLREKLVVSRWLKRRSMPSGVQMATARSLN